MILLGFVALFACAEGDDPTDLFPDSGTWTAPDAATPPPYIPNDAGQFPNWPDASQSLPDASQSLPDAGGPLAPDASVDAGDPSGGLLGGLFGGGGMADAGPTTDASRPPPTGDNPEGWTLNADSSAECPDVPPPIPVIGGLCLGIYFGCGWTNAAGAQYSCICDWVHWLCI